MTKYFFVTGGVVSSLGKGLAAASLGCDHAVTIAGTDESSDADYLQIVDQVHAASDATSIVIHPGPDLEVRERLSRIMYREGALRSLGETNLSGGMLTPEAPFRLRLDADQKFPGETMQTLGQEEQPTQAKEGAAESLRAEDHGTALFFAESPGMQAWIPRSPPFQITSRPGSQLVILGATRTGKTKGFTTKDTQVPAAISLPSW